MTPLEMPRRIASLPRDHRGFPVPWFVAWVNGEPDFRCVAEGRVAEALRSKVCWVCGEPLGRYMTFVTGPLTAVNGTAAEPPAHHDCAEDSARSCPFLTKPRMRRNAKDLASDAPHPAGPMIERNPGVTLLWTTREFRAVPRGGGVLFRVGAPHRIEWMSEGRAATRAEVLHSLEGGLVHLRAMAEAEGPAAMAALERLSAASLDLLPPY